MLVYTVYNSKFTQMNDEDSLYKKLFPLQKPERTNSLACNDAHSPMQKEGVELIT